MFIDIHAHVRKYAVPVRAGRQAFATPEQLIARHDRMGIEKAVLLPMIKAECSLVPQSIYEVTDICRNFPGRFIPFCNVDPRAADNSPDAPLGEIIDHHVSEGCRGVGEISANLPITDGRVRNLFRCVEKAGLPLTFHLAARLGGTYGLCDEPGLPGLERALRDFPGLRFLAHSQVFWAEMGPLEAPADREGYPAGPIDREGVVPKLFRRYPNLLGDLSAGSGYNALARDPGYAVSFLEEFQDRLFFGTDIVVPDGAAPLAGFLLGLKNEGRLGETVFRKVARENAFKLLKLEEDRK